MAEERRQCEYMDSHGKQCTVHSGRAGGHCFVHSGRSSHHLCPTEGCDKWTKGSRGTEFCTKHALKQVRGGMLDQHAITNKLREEIAALKRDLILLRAENEEFKAVNEELRQLNGLPMAAYNELVVDFQQCIAEKKELEEHYNNAMEINRKTVDAANMTHELVEKLEEENERLKAALKTCNELAQKMKKEAHKVRDEIDAIVAI